jgi:uncharacterized protein (TIGR00251 family)
MTRRFVISAKPKSGKNEVIVDPDDAAHLTVRTTRPPDKGKANEAILRLLADHFNVPRSRLDIVSGETSRTKLVDISDE